MRVFRRIPVKASRRTQSFVTYKSPYINQNERSPDSVDPQVYYTSQYWTLGKAKYMIWSEVEVGYIFFRMLVSLFHT